MAADDIRLFDKIHELTVLLHPGQRVWRYREHDAICLTVYGENMSVIFDLYHVPGTEDTSCITYLATERFTSLESLKEFLHTTYDERT